MSKKIKIIIILCVILFCNISCSRNVEKVQKHAASVFEENGFKIIGYHGYGLPFLSIFSGGVCWYTIEKIGDEHHITYESAIIHWFGEYHMYSLRAIDALSPNK